MTTLIDARDSLVKQKEGWLEDAKVAMANTKQLPLDLQRLEADSVSLYDSSQDTIQVTYRFWGEERDERAKSLLKALQKQDIQFMGKPEASYSREVFKMEGEAIVTRDDAGGSKLHVMVIVEGLEKPPSCTIVETERVVKSFEVICEG